MGMAMCVASILVVFDTPGGYLLFEFDEDLEDVDAPQACFSKTLLGLNGNRYSRSLRPHQSSVSDIPRGIGPFNSSNG